MRKAFLFGCLISGLTLTLRAAEIQGVVADWSCVQRMVQNGREKTLRQDNHCSLMKDYRREAYGVITDERKYFRLEDPGNSKILQILKDSSARDNLHVIVSGELEGNTLKVQTISLL